jgi:hypothetical protein
MRAEHRDFQLPEVRFQTAKAQVKYADSNCSIPRHVFFDLKVYLIGSHFFELTVYQSKRRPNHCKMQTEQDPLHWFRRALDKVFCFRTRGIITWYRSPRRTLNVISLKHICPGGQAKLKWNANKASPGLVNRRTMGQARLVGVSTAYRYSPSSSRL